jgi:hypothetical protein
MSDALTPPTLPASIAFSKTAGIRTSQSGPSISGVNDELTDVRLLEQGVGVEPGQHATHVDAPPAGPTTRDIGDTDDECTLLGRNLSDVASDVAKTLNDDPLAGQVLALSGEGGRGDRYDAPSGRLDSNRDTPKGAACPWPPQTTSRPVRNTHP